MKHFTISLAMLFFSIACSSADNNVKEQDADTVQEVVEEVTETETLPEKKKPKSPRMQSANEVNGVEVMIDYGSPYVKGRTIWGELVPFNKVWRAGANETTKLVLADKVDIEGQSIEAGTYGLLIIPRTEGDWVVILNEAWDYDQHGIWGSNGYDEEKDIARFEVTPKFVDELEESLTYTVTTDKLTFAWEYARFEMNLSH